MHHYQKPYIMSEYMGQCVIKWGLILIDIKSSTDDGDWRLPNTRKERASKLVLNVKSNKMYVAKYHRGSVVDEYLIVFCQNLGITRENISHLHTHSQLCLVYDFRCL